MANEEAWDSNLRFEISPRFFAKLDKRLPRTNLSYKKLVAEVGAENMPSLEDWTALNKENRKHVVQTVAEKPLKKLIMRRKDSAIITPAELFSDPNFDPNAMLVACDPHAQGEDKISGRYPVMALLFSQIVSEKEFDRFLKKEPDTVIPDGLLTASGDCYEGINRFEGAFAPPLLGSVLNHGWNIQAILAHPQVNPNIHVPSASYAQYAIGSRDKTSRDYLLSPTANDSKFVLGWLDLYSITQHPNNQQTPLEILCQFFYKDCLGVAAKRDNHGLLRKHYIDAISGMIDAGAIVTPDVEEIIAKEQQLIKKVDQIKTRLAILEKGNFSELTAQDVKHAYAFSRMGSLLRNVDAYPENASSLLELQSEIPNWLKKELRNVFTLIESESEQAPWTEVITARRNTPTPDKGGSHGK